MSVLLGKNKMSRGVMFYECLVRDHVEPYSSNDNIQDITFTCTQRNLVINIATYMANNSISNGRGKNRRT